MAGTARFDERGSAMVEFVLVFQLVLLVLFGIIEMGFLLNSKLVVSQAARVGSRRAAVEGGYTAEVREIVERQIEMGKLDPERLQLTVTPKSAAYGSTIRLEIRYSYSPKTPVVGSMLGDDFFLTTVLFTRSERVTY